MRLIDADKIMADIASNERSTSKDYILLTIARYIRIQPTIEGEPVVHCKDCKFNYANQIPSGDDCQLCVELPISKDFFCAYGEKMDEVNND